MIDTLCAETSPELARHLGILAAVWGVNEVRVTETGHYLLQKEPDDLFSYFARAREIQFPRDPDHTAQAVWETLIARGFFPESWLADDRRVFVRSPVPPPVRKPPSRGPAASYLETGYVFAPYIPILQTPVVTGPEIAPRTAPPSRPGVRSDDFGALDFDGNFRVFRDAPPFSAECPFPALDHQRDLAFLPRAHLETIEALVGEIATRLRPFGVSPPTRIAWGFGFPKSPHPDARTARVVWALLASPYANVAARYVRRVSPSMRAAMRKNWQNPTPDLLADLSAMWGVYFESEDPLEPCAALDAVTNSVYLAGFHESTAVLHVHPVTPKW